MKIGGGKFDYSAMKNEKARTKSIEIGTKYGAPDLIEKDSKGNITKLTWKNIEGHAMVSVYNDIYRKWHPYPASVFVETARYIKVPEHLLGPLKYASETINIDQIRGKKADNTVFGNTGKKGTSLVTGSCGSITISAVTVKFVEDMCKKYKKPVENPLLLFREFRKEYDSRIATYLHGDGIVPKISWYPNRLEKEYNHVVHIPKKDQIKIKKTKKSYKNLSKNNKQKIFKKTIKNLK